MTLTNQYKTASVLESQFGLKIKNLRRVKAGDDTQFYVLTDQGLLTCTINRRTLKVTTCQGVFIPAKVTLPKGGHFATVQSVELPKTAAKTYEPAYMLENAPSWVPEADAKIWRQAVHILTGDKKPGTYSAAIGIYMNLKNSAGNERN